MARLKLPFTKRDKFVASGGLDVDLQDLDEQEFYIHGQVYKVGNTTNRDGTIPLSKLPEHQPQGMSAYIYKKFFESQPGDTSHDESWTNQPPGKPGLDESLTNQPPGKSPSDAGTNLGSNNSASKLINMKSKLLNTSEGAPSEKRPNKAWLPSIREDPMLEMGDFVIKYYASITDMFWAVLALITHILPYIFQIILMILYIVSGYYAWFALTLFFFFVPLVVMSSFSLALYCRDYTIVKVKVSIFSWMFRVLFLTSLMAVTLRLLNILSLGCISRHKEGTEDQKRNYDRMIDEEADTSMVRLIEGMGMCASQMLLQLIILMMWVKPPSSSIITLQCLCIAFCYISMVMCLVGFHKALRISQPDKGLMTRPGLLMMIAWRACTLGTRILAIAVFTYHFRYMVIVVAVIHWICMLVWLYAQDTQHCMLSNKEAKETHSRVGEFFFRLSIGYIQIFDWLNILEGPSRLRCALYYIIVYAENVAMIVSFYIKTSIVDGKPVSFDSTVIILVSLGMVIGTFLMVVYYKLFHPNNVSYLYEEKHIKWWIPLAELSLVRDTTPFFYEDFEEGNVAQSDAPTGVSRDIVPTLPNQYSSDLVPLQPRHNNGTRVPALPDQPVVVVHQPPPAVYQPVPAVRKPEPAAQQQPLVSHVPDDIEDHEPLGDYEPQDIEQLEGANAVVEPEGVEIGEEAGDKPKVAPKPKKKKPRPQPRPTLPNRYLRASVKKDKGAGDHTEV